MRTTISLDDNLLRSARERALVRNVTLSQLVEDALRVALGPTGESAALRSPLPVSKRRGGTRPGIDVSDGAGLRDVMNQT